MEIFQLDTDVRKEIQAGLTSYNANMKKIEPASTPTDKCERKFRLASLDLCSRSLRLVTNAEQCAQENVMKLPPYDSNTRPHRIPRQCFYITPVPYDGAKTWDKL